MLVLLRNSARDTKKGDKFKRRWLGPYEIKESLGKNVFRLSNPTTGIQWLQVSDIQSIQLLVFTKSICIHRLKLFIRKRTPPKLVSNDIFQCGSPDFDSIFKTPPPKRSPPQIYPDSVTPPPPPMPRSLHPLYTSSTPYSVSPLSSPDLAAFNIGPTACKRRLFTLSSEDDNSLSRDFSEDTCRYDLSVPVE